MSDNNYDYECAFSAKRAEGAMDYDGDNLGDLPVGWIALTMKRRVYNPEWTALQQTKMAMVPNLSWGKLQAPSPAASALEGLLESAVLVESAGDSMADSIESTGSLILANTTASTKKRAPRKR